MLLTGCLTQCTARNPEGAFQQAERSYQQGNLRLAQDQATEGALRFGQNNAQLADKFRALQIQAMLTRGQYHPALQELARWTLGQPADCETAARRNMLGASAYFAIGSDSEALRSLAEAEKQCPSASPALRADLATRRAIIFDSDPLVAEADFRTSLDIAREQHDTYREAGALLNLGFAKSDLERYDEAIEWSQGALRISKQFGYKVYEEKAGGNLAFAFFKLGDFDQALTLGKSAAHEARTMDVGYDRIRWLTNLGLVYEEARQFELAKSSYREALTLAREQSDLDQTTIALTELAYVCIRAETWDEAAAYSKQALAAAQHEQNVPMELEALLAEGLIAAHRGDLLTSEKLLSRVSRASGHDRQSSRWVAQTTMAELYATEGKVGAAKAEYERALSTFRQARCFIGHEESRLPFLGNATALFGSYIDFLAKQAKPLEALKIADEGRALTLAEGLGVEGKTCLAAEDGFDPRRIAREEEATLLFYWLGAEHSYMWAVTPDRIRLYPLPPAAEIEPAVHAYRRALTGSRDVLASEDVNGVKLYQTLVAPASEVFRHDGRVIVITDGVLSGLNFETLLAPSPKPHYWIEDVTLQNASSLRLLAASPRNRVPPAKKLLLMGDSTAPSDGQFAVLPHAADEMRSVDKYFPVADKQIYERANSTPVAYAASHPEQYGYIHFVAHGTASQTNPLDSAVVLSPSGPDGAYKLYARDVIAHPLEAELVTVSTCKGAGVRTYTGEGLVGLSWAFLHAGAHNVIGALWDVSDEATPQLMDKMYAELVSGKSPDASLRTAKLSLLRSSGTPFHKPIYWAGFQLYAGS